MPVYRPRSVNPDAGASSVADALELWTPPVFQEDPLAGRMSQRLGASSSLSAFAPYQPKPEGGLRIGAGALVEVDPGQVIQLQSRGMLRISGTLRAPGGRIEAARGADPVVGIQLQKGGLSNSIWLDGQARLDVAGISATGIDTAGRQYGLQRDGGRIALDGEFVVIRPGGAGRVGNAHGCRCPDAGRGGRSHAHRRQGRRNRAVRDGRALSRRRHAGRGTPDAPGGKLASLGNATHDAGTPDEMIRPRELVVARRRARRLRRRARPDSVTLSYGQGRIGVDQILAGGFDEVSLMARDLVTFDGNVDLGLRRAINLYEGALGNTRAGATVRLAAPYVLLSGRTSLLPRRLRLCRYSPRWKNGGRQGKETPRGSALKQTISTSAISSARASRARSRSMAA